MGIFAEVDGKKVEFHNFTFDSANSIFTSEIDKSTGVSLSVETSANLDTSFENKEFHVHFLSKKGLLESEIFQVFDKFRERRIGWCIPVNALNSSEHNFATDEHFQRYAYIGLKNALNSIGPGIFTNFPCIDKGNTPSISGILPESTALLIISQETLDREFIISMWLPALANLGYFQLTNIAPENICIQRPKISESQISLTPISQEIGSLDYITAIYSRTLPFEKKSVFQFFYLYQIIELMMELVFKTEQAKLVQDIISAQEDTNATKEILDKANQNASEKRRMGLLARNYCCCENDFGSLITACNNLLRELGKSEGSNLETALYPIRNFLFHQFRNFPTTAEPALEDLIVNFSAFLPILLANFRYPANLPTL